MSGAYVLIADAPRRPVVTAIEIARVLTTASLKDGLPSGGAS
jgi:hypothetical protein